MCLPRYEVGLLIFKMLSDTRRLLLLFVFVWIFAFCFRLDSSFVWIFLNESMSIGPRGGGFLEFRIHVPVMSTKKPTQLGCRAGFMDEKPTQSQRALVSEGSHI